LAERDDKRRQEQADQMWRKAEQNRQDGKKKVKTERKVDNSAKARKYGQAIRR